MKIQKKELFTACKLRTTPLQNRAFTSGIRNYKNFNFSHFLMNQNDKNTFFFFSKIELSPAGKTRERITKQPNFHISQPKQLALQLLITLSATK